MTSRRHRGTANPSTARGSASLSMVLLLLILPLLAPPALEIGAAYAQEPVSNSVSVPTQILKTGINLSSSTLSPNSLQVAQITGLMPVLNKLQKLREQVNASRDASPTLATLAMRQDYYEAQLLARQGIEQANLEIDYVLAEINAERNLYAEILSSLIAKRDRAVAHSNAASFYTNGVLWAVGEAFDIPTYRSPRLSIPSGTVSILAGIVPSFFSLYAMRQYNGKKLDSEEEPNMLAKLFDYPINPEVDYPPSIMGFLNTVPPESGVKKTRKDQLIDRWLTDQNIPSFTDRKNKAVLDGITGTISHRKALSIDVLTARQDMLQQLAGEVMKMKRMLLELSLAANGDKTI
ncbi:MAG: hypothetical protein KGS72_07495 [Cyanobacteria bacterium REEB67]|nr:hypothetical protein [Cyanobacteria bacterium REEB67]